MGQTHDSRPSADPSNLYGRVFPKEVRNAIFAQAITLFAYKPEQRDDFVGTEYYVLRTLEKIGEAMIATATAQVEAGVGHNTAWGPWFDFCEMVAKGSYFPKPYVPTEKPKTTAKPVAAVSADLKLGVTLGDQVGSEKIEELRQAITPAPAPATTLAPNKKKGKGKPAAEIAPAEVEEEEPKAAQA